MIVNILTFMQLSQDGNMKKILLVLITLIFSSCYQVDSLPAIGSVSDNFLLCSKDNNEGPFEKFGSLNSNLNEFYELYVKDPSGNDLPSEIDYTRNLDYDSRVDYKKLLSAKESTQTKSLRNSILGHINSLELNKLTTDEQIAALINAYNFIAIDIVIQNSCDGLIDSIADLGGKESFKAFSDKRNFGYLVAAEKLSLDNIEKDKIAELTNYEDARIHFAVICASGGCPVLLHKPFTGTDLNSQLNFITRAGLRLPRMFNNQDGVSYLSSIFDWYLDDFVSDIDRTNEFDTDEEYIQEFIKRFTPAGTTFNVDDIDFVDYDWTINKL